MPKPKTKIPENKLLKALTELEDAIEKGDSLEDADPEGGLSTEGTPLSNKAPSGRGETKKSRSSDSDDDDDDDDHDYSSGDDEETSKAMSASEEAPPFASKNGGSDESSSDESDDDDDGGGDDDSDDDTEKSFRETADGDETMAKAIEVSDFIEAMVDQLSRSMGQMAKSLNRIEKRLGARIDNRVAKSMAHQQGFNTRLAQAVAAIGNVVQDDLVDVVKSFANSPSTPRGKAVLSKGEINQPPWSGSGASEQHMANGSDGGGGEYLAELSTLSSEQIGEWLFKKSMTNQIDSKLIMAWEADRYNVEALPVQVRKSLANDLCK
jgi:hypothetical protein